VNIVVGFGISGYTEIVGAGGYSGESDLEGKHC
jgi:hypothetical protein